MVRVPIPADPATGLDGDPLVSLRLLLQQGPNLRDPYQRDRALELLARVQMKTIVRLNALEVLVEKLAARPRSKGRNGQAKTPARPAKRGTKCRTGKVTKGAAPRTTTALAPAVYVPRDGSVVAHVLEALRTGGEWTTRDLITAVEQKVVEKKVTVEVVSAACGMLHRKGLARRKEVAHHAKGRWFKWRAVPLEEVPHV